MVLKAFAEKQFGLPTENDIPEEEVIRLAKKYVKERYGATDGENGLSKLKVYTSFDITDTERPICRIKFLPYLVEDYSDYESTAYVVDVNARTGEVMESKNRSEDELKSDDFL